MTIQLSSQVHVYVWASKYYIYLFIKSSLQTVIIFVSYIKKNYNTKAKNSVFWIVELIFWIDFLDDVNPRWQTSKSINMEWMYSLVIMFLFFKTLNIWLLFMSLSLSKLRTRFLVLISSHFRVPTWNNRFTVRIHVCSYILLVSHSSNQSLSSALNGQKTSLIVFFNDDKR